MPLDPDAARVLELMRGRPRIETLTPAQARANSVAGRAVTAPEPAEVASVRDLLAPGAAGPIALRVYRAAGPAPDATLPLLVFFHGGGWVVGDLDSHDTTCRALANEAGAVVVSVDYRLAPEHPFPAAVEDCIAATEWAAAHAGELGADAQRLAVGGDSAGGNLATVVALAARDSASPKIGFQMLIYPVIDFAEERQSWRRLAEGFGLTATGMRWYAAHYLGSASAEDWRASPIRAANLAGLPPAWILVAGHDLLSDEAEDYAKQLAAAGVPVELRRCEGQIHGFIGMGKLIAESSRILAEAGAAVAGALR